MSAAASPSSWVLQRVVALAQQTIVRLRHEDGLVIDTEEEALAALAHEGVDARKILCGAARAAIDAKQLGIAQDARIKDLQTRRARSKASEDAWRATAAAIMEALLPADEKGNRKFADPEFSLSLAPGKPQLQIDEAKLPPAMIEITTLRTPKKAEIRAALEAGQAISGASYSNGTSPILTVRTR